MPDKANKAPDKVMPDKADNDDLRRLVSSAVTILECLEDETEDLQMRVRILDLAESLRSVRRTIDSIAIAESALAYERITSDLRTSAQELRRLESALQESLARTEARLQRIGDIAALIKKVF